MNRDGPVWQIAVPSPLNRTFDYLPARPAGAALPGARVRVPFGRTSKIGILVAVAAHSRIAGERLRRATELLDAEPLLTGELMSLLQWAAGYYHYPLGEALLGAIPTLLRQGAQAQERVARRWRLTEAGTSATAPLLRAPRQQALLRRLREAQDGLSAEEIAAEPGWRPALKALIAKGWVRSEEQETRAEAGRPAGAAMEPAPELNDSQRAAAAELCAAAGFQSFLLDGVTGSGKTEVYFRAIDEVLRSGRQALVLVPEIGLTPQLVARFRQRFTAPLAVLHSALPDRERLDAWLGARSGRLAIVIGTRSAVFTPLARPGIIVVDEEHDSSYKQQDGFRYHARDIALVRGRRLDIPVVLGSATPALETLLNSEQGRHRRLVLAARAGAARPPAVRLIDLRGQALRNGLSEPLLRAIERHLAAGNQALLFLNRRGYAPTLLCHDCGWVAGCGRCDAHMILHRAQAVLRCHHCDAQRPADTVCPQCGGSELRPLGQGTERVEEALTARFPAAAVIRMDRDSTRRKGAMQSLLEDVREGGNQILLGTQMLAKGHDLPNVTLAGILDADQGLFGADFRAAERMGQLITQVAGRAGRAHKPGEVLIQTHHPEHPLLATLLTHDYPVFARRLLAERRETGLPPYGCLALLRAESVRPGAALAFLSAVQALAADIGGEVLLLGPAPALMERRAGRYRAQLLLRAAQRRPLHRLLDALVPQLDALPAAGRVRWSLDVDPIDER